MGAIKPLEERTGIDCVLNAMHYHAPTWVSHMLSSEDSKRIEQLLPELPPLHGYMTEEDWVEFSEKWFKLCKDEPKWSPRVGAEIKDRPRVGMGCILSKKDVLLDEWWMPTLVSLEDKMILTKLLPRLPELHGKMSEGEIQSFLSKYRDLPDRPAWEPYIINEKARKNDLDKQRETRRDHANRLEEAIQAGRLAAVSEDHQPRKHFTRGVYISQQEALDYLSQLNLLHVLEKKFSSEEDIRKIITISASDNTVNAEVGGMLERAESQVGELSGDEQVEGDVERNNDTSSPEELASGQREPTYEEMIIAAREGRQMDDLVEYIALAMEARKSNFPGKIWAWLKARANDKDYSVLKGVVSNGIQYVPREGESVETLTRTHLKDRLYRLRKKVREQWLLT
ncbi:hypothetical protein [Herbaspirillum lusitanum]|uniref:hypothetical protein n=1 Tax=Herbaspirillum lusitanum TaxID=213312 RepID=UPI0022373919|nr:hypothetical protein [Herbaspirillum lusitanum]